MENKLYFNHSKILEEKPPTSFSGTKRKRDDDPPRVLLDRVSLSSSDYPRRKIHALPESDEGRRKISTSTETNKTPPKTQIKITRSPWCSRNNFSMKDSPSNPLSKIQKPPVLFPVLSKTLILLSQNKNTKTTASRSLLSPLSSNNQITN